MTMHEYRSIIRAEIHAVAGEIKQLKRWWRTPPDVRPEPPNTRFGLAWSKWRATLLCMLMAHSRGRVHLGSMSGVEEQAAFLDDELGEMDKMKLQTPVLDDRLRETARCILAQRKAAA